MEAFFKFQIRFRIIGRKQKNIQTNSEVWILIKDKCNVCISLESSRHALQNDGKLFSNFEMIFWITTLFKIIVALVSGKLGGGGGTLVYILLASRSICDVFFYNTCAVGGIYGF